MKNNLPRFFVVFLLGASFSLSACASQSSHLRPLRIGYVNLQRILKDSTDGRLATQQLLTIKQKYQRILYKKQQQLKAIKRKYDATSHKLSKVDMLLARNSLTLRVTKLQSQFRNLSKRLKFMEIRASRRIYSRASEIIREVAKEKKLDYVLEVKESALLYAQKSYEFTNEVLRRYNKRYNKTR